MTPPIKLNCTSLRHAATFKCLGSTCENNCCHGWEITLDKISYEITKTQLSRTAAGRIQFRQNINKRDKNRTSTSYADIIHSENGDCPFLDPADKLCILHRDFGESCISQICRTYPRKIALIDNHFELSLELSCPEATRIFLLDQEFDLIQIDHSPFSTRNFSCDIYPIDETNPLTQHINLVRGTVLKILNNRCYPLNSRLFISSFFTNRTVSFFSPQNEFFTETLLVEEINHIADQQLMNTLHNQFESLACDEGLPLDLPMSFILSILMGKTGELGILTKLLLKAWQNFGLISQFPLESKKEIQGDFTKIIAEYKKMRTKTPRAVKEQFDNYLDKYSQYFWYCHIYIESPNLLIHTRKLFIRLALLRFFLYSHPAINELRHLDLNATLSSQQIDTVFTVAVEVFSRIALAIEHSPEILTEIEQTLDKNNMQNIEHVCLLLLI